MTSTCCVPIVIQVGPFEGSISEIVTFGVCPLVELFADAKPQIAKIQQ